MYLRNVLGVVALSASAAAQVTSPELIYQFENSFSGVGYVNIENVAVRSSNGQLLLNFVTGAIVAQLNPDAKNPKPELLVNISNAYPGAPASLVGIAETGNDIFTVAAGNFVYGPQVVGGIAGVNGSFSVWNVDLTGPKANAYKVTDIPEAGSLNGVIKYPSKDDTLHVLIADSALGVIWKVNTDTGEYTKWVSDPLLLPAPYFQFGVNGIRAAGPYLYFTNSAFGIFGAFKLNDDGTPASAAIPFVSAPNGSSFDDFALDSQGNAYVASAPSSIYELRREVTTPILYVNASTILGPTSCVFRGHDELFFVTGGKGGGPMGPQSGQIYKVKTSSSSKRARSWMA